MVTPQSELATRLAQPGVTYRTLADQLGVSAGHLCHIAKGRKPANDELLEKLGLERVTIVRYRRRRLP